MVTKASNHGFALLIAIAAVALLGGSVLIVSQHLQTDVVDYRRELRDVTLVALSDAALAETLARLSTDPGFGGLPRRSFGGGTVESAVHKPSSGRSAVVATALAMGWRATIKADVEHTPEGLRVRQWTRRFAR